MSISFNHSNQWATIQNSLGELSRKVESSTEDDLEMEVECLSEPIRERIFHHLRSLTGQPAGPELENVHLFDSKDRLIQAIHQTGIDMFNLLNPLESKTENLSPYARLLKIYTFDKNSPPEELQAHLDLLPEPLKQKLSQHTQTLSSKFSSRELGLIESLPILKQAVRQVSSEILNSMPTSQRWVIFSKRDKSDLSNSCDRTFLELQILDEINLLLSPPQDLEIFMAALKIRKDLWQHIPTFVPYLGIQDQNILFELAMLCAEHHTKETAENIAEFGIQDEKARIAIAKVCAQRDPLMTADNIAKFKIQDEKALIEIAILCAQRSGVGTALNIKNFCIRDKNVRIEVAKLCAKQNGAGTAQFIRHFNIPVRDQAALVEIFKLCEEHSLCGTAGFIQDFKIQSEKDRIEIAMVCAKKNGSTLADNIQKFDIQDQDTLILLAKLCAMQSTYTTARKIKSFNIQSQAALIEIAKSCALNGAWGLVQFIQNFGIQDERARIEIAKIAARGDGGGTAYNIKNFGIQKNQALFEIAMLCAEQNGTSTARNLQMFNIQDSQAIFLIGMHCLLYSMGEAYEYLQNIPEISEFKPLFEAYKKQTLSEELLVQSLHDFIVKHLGDRSPFLQSLETLGQIKNPHAQHQTGVWLASIFVFIAKLSPTQQEDLFETGLVEALCSMRSPPLRLKFSLLLIEFVRNENALKLFLDGPRDPKTRVLDFLLSSLQVSGVANTTTAAVKELLFPVFSGRMEIRPLLEMLYQLHASKSLLPVEKQGILDELCMKAKRQPGERQNDYGNRIGKERPLLKKKVLSLLTLLLFQEEKRLFEKVPYLASSHRISPELRKKTNPILSILLAEEAATFEAIFKERGFIAHYTDEVLYEKLSLLPQEDQIQKLYEKLMPERNPTALMIYAAKLSSLHDPAVMRDLGRYVNGVLAGTFSQDRYRVEHNPHLEQIAKNNAPTLLKWQEPLAAEEVKFLPETPSQFKVADWLYEKIIQDGHLEPTPTPHLLALIDKLPVNENTLSPIERALKGLIWASSKEKQITALKEIQDELLNLPFCEFRANVAEQLEALEKEPSNMPQDVLLVDTDAYFDLLMSGTEVSQSCQNVSGAPALNKGLLGYLLDGKNRILAVKDKQGKILARAKLSLLWDGEKPALFLERLYTQGRYENQCRQAIAKMALDKAKGLGLELVVLKDSGYAEGKAFDKDLQALESGVSYEYSDAMRGVQKDGKYTIPKTILSVFKV